MEIHRGKELRGSIKLFAAERSCEMVTPATLAATNKLLAKGILAKYSSMHALIHSV